MKYVILGNGVAGITAAETIRKNDPGGEITLIGDETFTPYCRPMISMVLEGTIGPERLPIRRTDFYETTAITPVLGERVTAIDVDNRTVSCSRSGSHPYDRLLIATGADPRPIKADGLELDNISYMRTEAHIRRMLTSLPSAKKALVLGGGLVGFKAAYGLLRRGLQVTMLIRSGYPLSLQVDETAGKLILDELIRHGLDVRVNVAVEAFDGNGKVQSARLSDGSRLDCDMVVIGKGVLPAHSFVPNDRIDIDLGIMVDKHMATSVEGIYAAGDVAEFIDVARNIRWVNAIWPEAVSQGRIAGLNMVGRQVGYKGSLSRNVIRIFDMDIMTGGVVNPPDEETYETTVFMDAHQKIYRKLIFKDAVLIGVVMVNAIEQGGVLISAMHSRVPIRIPNERLIGPGFNYRQLLWQRTLPEHVSSEICSPL